MNTKEMRQALREAGLHVPRSNDETIKAYEDFLQKENISELSQKEIEPMAEIKSIKLVSSNIYTYVGMGDEPPHKIKFMGVQWFTRGLPTEVKPEILEAVSNHACFRKGKVNMDEYYDIDEAEKKKADLQREEDLKIQIEIERVNRKA